MTYEASLTSNSGAQTKKVHAVVCFYGIHYYVSALFFDPTSAIARCRKEINNSAYPDSWKVFEFEIEDTLDSVQPTPSVPKLHAGTLPSINQDAYPKMEGR